MAVAERAELNTHKHEEATLRDRLVLAQDSLGVAQGKLEKLQADETKLRDRRADVSCLPACTALCLGTS